MAIAAGVPVVALLPALLGPATVAITNSIKLPATSSNSIPARLTEGRAKIAALTDECALMSAPLNTHRLIECQFFYKFEVYKIARECGMRDIISTATLELQTAIDKINFYYSSNPFPSARRFISLKDGRVMHTYQGISEEMVNSYITRGTCKQ